MRPRYAGRVGLRVTVLELPASWDEPRAALERVDALLATGPETDLVLLPEACLTGYVSPEGDFDLAPFAEPPGGPTARAASALAVRRGVHLASPVILREDGACFNAVAVHDPSGRTLATYAKRHPWIPETWATAGSAPLPLVSIRGVTVTIAICYDIHFLEAESAAELQAADLLLFPSAWVDDEDTLPARLRALARRFSLFVANANWAPGAVTVRGQGGSCFVDPAGAVVAHVGPGGARADFVVG